jgi:hypothetical protein
MESEPFIQGVIRFLFFKSFFETLRKTVSHPSVGVKESLASVTPASRRLRASFPDSKIAGKMPALQ